MRLKLLEGIGASVLRSSHGRGATLPQDRGRLLRKGMQPARHCGSGQSPLRRLRRGQIRLKPSPSSSSVEIGAAWSKRSNEGRDYLGLKLDDPSFTAPIFANPSMVIDRPEAIDGEQGA